MSVIKVNINNFNDIKNLNKPVLIDFYADWCVPCRLLSPIIDEIANERDDIVVGKVNVDDEPQLAAMFKIFSIPTVVVLDNGSISSRVSGVRNKEQILAMLN